MSAIGTKRTFQLRPRLSAIGPKWTKTDFGPEMSLRKPDIDPRWSGAATPICDKISETGAAIVLKRLSPVARPRPIEHGPKLPSKGNTFVTKRVIRKWLQMCRFWRIDGGR